MKRVFCISTLVLAAVVLVISPVLASHTVPELNISTDFNYDVASNGNQAGGNNGGFGPGDGTGDGDGPQDGTGNGPGIC